MLSWVSVPYPFHTCYIPVPDQTKYLAHTHPVSLWEPPELWIGVWIGMCARPCSGPFILSSSHICRARHVSERRLLAVSRISQSTAVHLMQTSQLCPLRRDHPKSMLPLLLWSQLRFTCLERLAHFSLTLNSPKTAFIRTPTP